MGGQAGGEATRYRAYIPGLDGIRALAVSLVLFSHSVIFDQFTGLRGMGLNAGYTGVAIFFVLSGYLITRLLLREEETTGSISLKLFYIRRAFRLFPALWLYLAVVFGIWLFGAIPDHPLHSFVTSLLYIRNLVGRGHETDHLWSLSIEEQFYLIWAVALVALGQRQRTRLLVAVGVVVGVTIWRIYAARNGLASAGALYNRSDFRFDAPLVGCVLALVERIAPGAISTFNSTGLRSDTLTIVAIGCVALWVGLRLDEVTYPGTDATVASVLGILLVVSQIGAEGVIGRLLTWRPFIALGEMSYGVYLWQELFLGPRRGVFQVIRTFPIGLAATLLVAAASFRLLEKPLLRLKDKRFHKHERNSLMRGGHASAASSQQ